VDDLPDAIQNAVWYMDDASCYVERQKRKYTEMNPREPTSIPEPPPTKHLKAKYNPQDTETEILDFVHDFKEHNTGRMNWQLCWETGVINATVIPTVCAYPEHKRTVFFFKSNIHIQLAMTEIREFDEIETVEVLQDSLDAEFLPELPEEQDIDTMA